MRKTIALDTNLLVLLVVGLTARKYISMHKRLQAYTEADYDLLKAFISVSAGVAVTPNVLSEASNLLRQIREPAQTRIAAVFRNLIMSMTTDSKGGGLHEIYIRSADASSRSEFIRLGLSDSALLEINKNNVVVLSADFLLYHAACAAGYEAMNFNHEREKPVYNAIA
jgi:hypothetical protein